MINAGISLSETFYLIASQEKSNERKGILLNIYNGLMKGEELYSCLNSYNKNFPLFFIKMVHLGEHSGNLEGILKSLQQYYQKEDMLVSKVKNSMTYPIVVLITSITVIMILILKVVPQFTDTLKDLGGEVPSITAFMISLCNFLSKNIFFIAIIAILCTFFSIKYFNTRGGRYKIHWFKLKAPFLKGIYEKILLAKFSRNLSLLLTSGFNIVKALEISSEICENSVFRLKIKACSQHIKKGENFCLALSLSGIANPLLLSLVKTGEETGKIQEVLNKASEYFEIELEERLKKMVSLVEPAMVISMAILIGFFIMAVMLPIVNVMDSIK